MLANEVNRRHFLLGAAVVALDPALPAGTRDEAVLDALPGKQDLIKLSWRPPNYETPRDAFAEIATPNDRFFVRYHLAGLPSKEDLVGWSLTVGGDAAEREIRLSLDDLKALPAAEIMAVCQCSGNRRGLMSPHVPGVQWGVGAMGNAVWRGVRLRDVLAKTGVRAGAVEVALRGADGPVLDATPPFRKSIPLDRAMDETVLLAWEMNGENLPIWNGYPLRLVVPGWTGTYWMKHLTRIDVLAKPLDGFWMQKAYRVPRGMFPTDRAFASQDNDKTSPITDIPVNSLITAPLDGAAVPAGGFSVRGIAWDGGHGIGRLDISTDGGGTWTAATLGKESGRFAFRPWSFAVAGAMPGKLTVMARATGADGATQPAKPIANPAGYNHNAIASLTVLAT